MNTRLPGPVVKAMSLALAEAEAEPVSGRVFVGVFGATVTATANHRTRRHGIRGIGRRRVVAPLVSLMVEVIMGDLPACYHRDVGMLRPSEAV